MGRTSLRPEDTCRWERGHWRLGLGLGSRTPISNPRSPKIARHVLLALCDARICWVTWRQARCHVVVPNMAGMGGCEVCVSVHAKQCGPLSHRVTARASMWYFGHTGNKARCGEKKNA